MAGTEQVVNHREEAGQGRGGYGGMAIGHTSSVGWVRKRVESAEWESSGLELGWWLLREGWGAQHGKQPLGSEASIPPTTCSFLVISALRNRCPLGLCFLCIILALDTKCRAVSVGSLGRILPMRVAVHSRFPGGVLAPWCCQCFEVLGLSVEWNWLELPHFRVECQMCA